ncbi:MAG: 4Fe-4S dicluster domain-containing protein [Chloroflexota bacterium]
MNHFVIADNRKCVACYACVAACAENHRKAGLQAYPRLYVTHTPAGAMPIQCRHCEDAMCALVCPVKAITHQEHSIQINESLCIGCKMCALACPFGNILPGGTPVPGQELNLGQYAFVNSPFQPDPMQLRELSYQEILSLLSWNVGQKTVAVKCDLCYFSEEGPACVIACPHKALILVDEENANIPVALAEQMKRVATMTEGEQ